MSEALSFDWNPGTYARFRGLRLRPALDLLARVDDIPPGGPVVDLGCGAGAVGPVLAKRYPGRRMIGVDAAPRAVTDRGDGFALATAVSRD